LATVKFWLGESVLFVDSVEDQWYGPDDVYFRVRADDGNTYVLRHNEGTDEWTLESFRSPTSPQTKAAARETDRLKFSTDKYLHQLQEKAGRMHMMKFIASKSNQAMRFRMTNYTWN
jgi:hypothetical protein